MKLSNPHLSHSNSSNWYSTPIPNIFNNTVSASLLNDVVNESAKTWFSEEQVEIIRNTVIEALYLALKPGTLPSACVFLFDCALTALHFMTSHYIQADFTTTFLGTVYAPCFPLKLIYIIQIFSNSEQVKQVADAINQIFNITIILSCMAYNIMCTFVLKYRQNIPLPVARSVFLPIVLFCSFVVIAPKLILVTMVDRLFQFIAQLFGSVFLLVQIGINIYLHITKKLHHHHKDDLKKEENTTDTDKCDVVRNASSRLVWANVFAFIIVLLTIPQIVDYYVPLTAGWISYHFLILSMAQLNSLLLSFTVFLVLPTYRTALCGCFGGYNKMKVAAALNDSKKKSKSRIATVEPSLADESLSEQVTDVEETKSIENEKQNQVPVHKPHAYMHHVAMQFGHHGGVAGIHHMNHMNQMNTINPNAGRGEIKIFMAPVTSNHVVVPVG